MAKQEVLFCGIPTLTGRGWSGFVYLITTTPIAHKVVKAKLVNVAAFIRLDKSPIRINRVVAHAWVENNYNIMSQSI